MKVTIGLPAYNEARNIKKIISDLQKSGYSVIVCNDGSTDNTEEIVKKTGVRLISHEKNLGYGAAIKSIFNEAKNIDTDILVTFDADGQHNILDIEKITAPIISDSADIVIGSRFLGEGKNKIPKYRKIGIQVISKLSQSSNGQKIQDAQSGLRGYNKKSINKINIVEKGMGVSTEILIKANKNELRIIEVPVIINYEGDTSTHNPTIHGLSVVLSTLKYVSVDHPLKFYGIPGLIFLIVGLYFVVWALQEFTIQGTILTNIAIIAASSTIIGFILLLSSIILFSLGVIVKEK